MTNQINGGTNSSFLPIRPAGTHGISSCMKERLQRRRGKAPGMIR